MRARATQVVPVTRAIREAKGLRVTQATPAITEPPVPAAPQALVGREVMEALLETPVTPAMLAQAVAVAVVAMVETTLFGTQSPEDLFPSTCSILREVGAVGRPGPQTLGVLLAMVEERPLRVMQVVLDFRGIQAQVLGQVTRVAPEMLEALRRLTGLLGLVQAEIRDQQAQQALRVRQVRPEVPVMQVIRLHLAQLTLRHPPLQAAQAATLAWEDRGVAAVMGVVQATLEMQVVPEIPEGLATQVIPAVAAQAEGRVPEAPEVAAADQIRSETFFSMALL